MSDTTYTLEQFLADTRATIKSKGIRSGLAEVRDHLEKLLHNPDLLKTHLGDPPPYTRLTTIGHDPETDVHVLVHGREKGSTSSVHDHGPCWVVYGSYSGRTDITLYRRTDDGREPGRASLEKKDLQHLSPGVVYPYLPGQIHSTHAVEGPAVVFRFLSYDLEKVERYRYSLEKGTMSRV